MGVDGERERWREMEREMERGGERERCGDGEVYIPSPVQPGPARPSPA